MFVKVKVSLQQVLGHSALLNTNVFQDMKPACQRLTIFQKLEIVRYADALIAESRKQADDKVEKPASKKHIGARIRDWQKGVNIQSACKAKFGNILGNIKVCQLRKAARKQKWEELTETQQKSTYQMSDALKVSLGNESSVKGWKSLGSKRAEVEIKAGRNLQRWRVPAPVLQDRNAKHYDLGLGGLNSTYFHSLSLNIYSKKQKNAVHIQHMNYMQYYYSFVLLQGGL